MKLGLFGSDDLMTTKGCLDWGLTMLIVVLIVLAIIFIVLSN